MPDTPNPDPQTVKTSALGQLAQRLKSQPLLLALAVLLVLANLAIASLEGLRALLPAAITVFVVAVVAWVLIEVIRMRRHEATAGGEQVRVSARRVGKSAEVFGIDDETGSPAGGDTSVTIKAEDIQGRVVGVRRGPRQS